MSVESLGTILGVWAHPDDETYLSAGLMARAVRSGSPVVCVTATRGEEGSFDEVRWPTATMGRVREVELLRSLEILGVREHHWLDYYDGTCAEVDHADAVARIEAFIDRIRPDSVLTFGPDGMTDHPDHKAACAWTTDAFERSAPPGARLYYATTTPEWAREWLPRMEPFNVFMGPGVPPITEHNELAIDLELPDELLDLKLAAIRAHESQIEGMMAVIGADGFRRFMRSEYFRLAAERPSIVA
jgi:LmbE family N-acetylglucosaminyl deacetylase